MRPRNMEIPYRCRACGFTWTFVLLLPCPIDRAIAALIAEVAAGCPKCETSKIEIARREVKA